MVKVEIPFKAVIQFDSGQIKISGPLNLLKKIEQLKNQYGLDPKNWKETSATTGDDILINEFILKVQQKFKLCYSHEELCHCRNVTTDKVFSAIKNNCFTVQEVSRTTLAGTGCGSCKKDIEDLIHQFKIS